MLLSDNHKTHYSMENEKILDISWKTILKISIAIACFYVLFLVRDILIWFIFALTISILANPAIEFLQKRKIPRILGTILIYAAVFGILGLLIYLIIPLFVSELKLFVGFLPQYFEDVSPLLQGLGFKAFDSVGSFVKNGSQYLEGMADNIFSVLFTIFGGFFTFLFIIVTAIFLSMEEKSIEQPLVLLFPKKYENFILGIWARCEKKVSGWFGARLLACLFIGLACWIAFLALNVKYSFTLALFAGVFNFVPYVGPLVTAVLLFLIVFPAEPFKGIFVLGVFWLIQLIENNVLSPILMRKFVGLPPALVLISLVVGGKLWGALGAVLAIPLFGILFEFLKEFLQKRKEKDIS